MRDSMVRFKRAFRCKVCLLAGVSVVAAMMLLTGCGARQAATQTPLPPTR